MRVPFALRASIIVITLCGSSWFWYQGLLHSPLAGSSVIEKQEGPRVDSNTAPAQPSRKNDQAMAYYRRYPDVHQHEYYGINGPLGIDGARQHYLHHGKREGRIWNGLPDQTSNAPP